MGGITRSLFGGSKSTSKSDNQAYGTLLGALKGNIGLGNNAMGTLGSFLGIGDPAAGKAATDNFLNSTGYQTMLDSGSKAITGNAASRGLLNSGTTGKALTKFGQDLGMTKVNELIQNLTSLGQFGLGSANTIAGAGQQSTRKDTNSGGIFNSLFPKGLSDRRTKRHIVKIGEFIDGLGFYEYEYVFAPGKKFRGVMADEVAELRPHALGPLAGIYATVDYPKLGIRGLENGPVMLKEAA